MGSLVLRVPVVLCRTSDGRWITCRAIVIPCGSVLHIELNGKPVRMDIPLN